MPPHILY